MNGDRIRDEVAQAVKSVMTDDWLEDFLVNIQDNMEFVDDEDQLLDRIDELVSEDFDIIKEVANILFDYLDFVKTVEWK